MHGPLRKGKGGEDKSWVDFKGLTLWGIRRAVRSSSSTAFVQSKIPYRLVLTVVRSNRKGHFYG